jgi:hypothetical protein
MLREKRDKCRLHGLAAIETRGIRCRMQGEGMALVWAAALARDLYGVTQRKRRKPPIHVYMQIGSTFCPKKFPVAIFGVLPMRLQACRLFRLVLDLRFQVACMHQWRYSDQTDRVETATRESSTSASPPIHSLTCSERFTAHPEVTPERVQCPGWRLSRHNLIPGHCGVYRD